MKKRFEKAKDIFLREGFWELIKRSFSSIIRYLFEYKISYLYENNLDNKLAYLPRIENYTFRIISTIDEVDVLIFDGFNIKSYYAGLDALKDRIDKGAILFSLFVNRELAHTSWVALTDKAKKDIDPVHFRIDFKNEVCAGDSRTNPKYQRLGIYNSVWSEAFPYLHERGIKKVKFSILKNNIVPQKSQIKLGSVKYGQVKYLKLLWFKFYQ